MSPARSVIVCAAALALGLVVATPTVAASTAATTSSPSAGAVTFGGSAFGSKGHLGSTVKSGKTALVAFCTLRPGRLHADHTAASTQKQVGSVGAVHTSVASQKSGDAVASVSTARTAGSSLLLKNVTGKAFVAKARVEHSSKGYRLSGATTLTDVRIFGQAAPQHPAVNQKMALPNIGTVVLNHQQRSTRFGLPTITVTAMTLKLNGGNKLGLPGGTLVLSRATANMHKPVFRQVTGNAYGSREVKGQQIISDKTAPVYLPCGGSNGQTRQNRTDKIAVKGLHTASTHTWARSTDRPKHTASILTSKVTGIHLLGNVIGASAVRAHAKAIRENGTLTRDSNNTKVVGLRINGQQQDGTQPPNTKYAIPGVGTLIVHKVVKTANGLQVYALQLTLSKAQDGLSKGTVLRVGGAIASVRPAHVLGGGVSASR
jgi:hypothetical protein